jgi:DNA-directed RNA polymerase subunit L
MKIRLSQITIPNIDIPITFLDDEYCIAISYSDPNRIKHPNDKMNIELFVNAINNTENAINVTTNDAQVFIDGELVNKFDPKYPHLLVQLKAKQVFKVRAVATLGVGLVNNIWAGVANAFYDEIDPTKNEYKFTLLSQGQLHEYELLYRTCRIIKYKMEKLKSVMQSGNISTEVLKKNSIRMKLEGINYTIGGVINEFMQINDNVSYSAITKPDHLVNEIIITLVTINKQPLTIFYETIDYCIKIYDEIEKQIVGLGKKYITVVK